MRYQDRLTQRFEADGTRRWAVAYRVLGSVGEAVDAVHEARLWRSRWDASLEYAPSGGSPRSWRGWS
jgi:hypothetical protein